MLIIKAFVKRKILSIETILSKEASKRPPPPHTHTHRPRTHEHSDDTKLNLNNLKRCSKRRLEMKLTVICLIGLVIYE